jgi:NAD(P)-dependent dehydrogenase (short-subunit alcohol dehydrogenase family)
MEASRYWPGEAAFARQNGKLAIVTGTGGLGLEVARKLIGLGSDVILAGRNTEKGKAAAISIAPIGKPEAARFAPLDLADLSSVAEFGQRMAAEGRPIDLLINNAGIMSPPQRRLSKDGFEAQFATNHLGHFALTARLLPLLCRSEAARVIHVTSLAHLHGMLDFDDLQGEAKYQPGVAYCRSKLAVALFARELHRRAGKHGWPIASIAAHPGFSGTNLFAAEGGEKSIMTILTRRVLVPLLGQSAANGALPILFAAASPDAQSGNLCGPTGFMDMKGPPGVRQFGSAALDEDVAERLWKVSEELTGIRWQSQ